jgi:hypothetical protein
VTIDRLGARELIEVVHAYRAALALHRDTLNRLNVFPVPDGDTGTNMLLTVEASVRELDERGCEGDDLAAAAEALGHGALMGARGNSGVILCQVLRALSRSFVTAADGPPAVVLAEALGAASEAARAAVLRPTEGTILTVAAAAADGAAEAAKAQADLLGVCLAARDAAQAGLWRTPELLAVLAEARVVDAGGAGLLLLFEALVAVIGEQPLREDLALPSAVAAVVAGASGPAGSAMAADPGGLRYEVMYLLEAPDESMSGFKDAWAAIGDSIVVVGGEGMWNCHIHTDDIGAAVEAALDVGRPREIRVTDLAEQVDEEQWVRQGGDAPLPPPPPGPPPVTSVVAVATGDGIRRIFRSLGVAVLVDGGQSMNPSTAELLAAIGATPGAEVVLLPNNGNIIPVARQAASAADRPVRVVATRGIQEGFAALLEFDPQCPSAENEAAMAEAAKRVVAGEVTRAVRAAETPAGHVEAGEWIGLSRAGIVAHGPDLVAATCALLERLLEPEHEIVTVIAGAGVGVGQMRQVTEWLKASHPALSIEEHRGGQPLYPILLSIE